MPKQPKPNKTAARQPVAAVPVAAPVDRRRTALLVCGIVGLGVAVMLLVHSHYWSAGPFFDDFDHRGMLREVDAGERTLPEFLFQLHNEHFLPAWKLWYFGMWRLSRHDFTVWHIAMSLAHLVSGLCLFVVLRHYLQHPVAAGVGTCLWLVAAIGGFENPLLWIGASHLSMALAWVLAAAACVTRLNRPRAALALAAMVACMALAVLTMGTTWLMLLALPVQVVLLERPASRTAAAPNRWRVWVGTWLATFVALGAWTLPMAAHTAGADAARRDPAALVEALARACANLELAWSRLLIGYRSVPDFARLATEVAIVSFVLVGALIVLRASWRRLLAGFVLVFPFVVLCQLARLSFPWQSVLDWGRYNYLPTLLGCIVAAEICEALLRRFQGTGRYVLALAITLTLTVATIRQLELARDSSELFNTIEQRIKSEVHSRRAAMQRLTEQARRQGRPVRMLEFPLAWPYLPYLSTLVDRLEDEVEGNVQVSIARAYTADDLAYARQTLGALQGDPVVDQWAQFLDKTAAAAQSLRARAAATGPPATVPNGTIAYSPTASLSVEEFLAIHYPGGLPGLKVVHRTAVTQGSAP
ncbi:MAG: hypothetical protein K1X74_17480 [Pirellulales bacterium]|nr:hypothetical protein [Pirellulales bacterium]